MAPFAPPLWTSLAFTALTLLVVAAEVVLAGRAAPGGKARRWRLWAGILALGWLGLHAGVAASGVLVGAGMPPPVMCYLVLTMAVGLALALSGLGRRLAQLPLAALVGLQAFRLPLEGLLHALYDAGALPVQMTWSGRNFDVVTGITALALGLLMMRRKVPLAVLWAWNIIGLGLLVNVVTIAVLSAPTPLRQFHDDPPVLLVFHPPFNWIVNVHVFTALVGHIVIFRALWRSGRNAAAGPQG